MGGAFFWLIAVRKVAPRLLLMLAGPVVFFGLLEGALYLTGRFELLPVLKQVRHAGAAYWVAAPPVIMTL